MSDKPREDRDSMEDEQEGYDSSKHEPTDTAADEEPMDTGRLHE